MKRKMGRVMAAGIVFFCLSAALSAQENDEVGIGRTITVAPGETRGDIACAHCTVYVRGTVKGDIAVFDGRAVIEGQVTGDLAVFWGDIRLADSSKVGGDIAVFGGVVKKSPTAVAGHDQAALTKEQVILLGIFILVCTGGLIALVVWLVVRRRTTPVQPVARSA